MESVGYEDVMERKNIYLVTPDDGKSLRRKLEHKTCSTDQVGYSVNLVVYLLQ